MNKNRIKLTLLSFVTVIGLIACDEGTVIPENKVPVANAQTITLDEDTSRTIILTATDADDDTLIYTVLTQPMHGILTGIAPNLTYVPTADYFGADAFTFKVNDGIVDSSVVTVTLSINNIPEPDRVKPVVTLNGDANISLYVDRVYRELNATAIDDRDGNVTSSVAISGLVNTTSLGVYTLTYTAIDSAGNEGNATRTVNILSNLRKTGQITSYDADGNEVANGTQRDDGYYQKGRTVSFTRDDTREVVTDNLTELVWQDDAAVASVTKSWLTNTNYNTCMNDTTSPACFDTTGDTSTTYCSELVLGGYEDWRLPMIEELEQLSNYGISRPTWDNIFQNFSLNLYGSATIVNGFEREIWRFDPAYGNVFWGDEYGAPYIRCVRDK